MSAVRALASAPCDDGLDAHRQRALRAVRLAQAEMGRIAVATDSASWRDVDVADLLDATVSLLARAASS